MAADREVSVRIPKRAYVLVETAVLVDTASIAGVPVTVEILYKGEPAVQYRSVGNGKILRFSFIPKRLGAHFVNILVNGYSLGDPALIDVRSPYYPDAARVRVFGPGLQHGDLDTYRGSVVCETVDAGTGVLMVNVLGPAGNVPVMTTALDGPNCPVAVSFQPPSAGDYYIHIKWTDDHVPGSPFKVELSERRKPGLMSKLFSKSPNQDASGPVAGFPPKEGEGDDRPPEGPSYEEIDHWVNTGLWSPSSSDSSSSGKENKPITPTIEAEQKADVSANLKRHQSFITRKYRAIVKRESKRERQAPLQPTTETSDSDDRVPSGSNEPSHVAEEVKVQADQNMASKMAADNKKEDTKPRFVAGVLRKSLRGNRSSYDLNHDDSNVKPDRRMSSQGMISDFHDTKLNNRLSQSQPDITPNRNTQGFVFLGKKTEEEIPPTSSPQNDTEDHGAKSPSKKMQRVSFVENEEVAKCPQEEETTKLKAQDKDENEKTSTPNDSNVEKSIEENKHQGNEKHEVKEKTTLCFPKKRKSKKNKSSPVIRKTDKNALPTPARPLSSMKPLSKSVEGLPFPSDVEKGKVSLVRVESIKW